MARVEDQTNPKDWNANFFQGIQALQQGVAAQQNSRRLDLEQMFYQNQAEQFKANQMIEKMKVIPQTIGALQNAGMDVTPEIAGKLAQSANLPDDFVNALSQMKPMTVTQTDENGNKTEIPINKVSAQYQAAVAKGTESYRRGLAMQGLKNEGAANVAGINARAKTDAAQIRNQGTLDKLSYQIKNSPAANNKMLASQLNFIARMHAQGAKPADITEQLNNLQETMQSINNPTAQMPNPSSDAGNIPTNGFFGLTRGEKAITNSQIINAMGGANKASSTIRDGLTITQDLKFLNEAMQTYKENPTKIKEIYTKFKNRWPEVSKVAGE